MIKAKAGKSGLLCSEWSASLSFSDTSNHRVALAMPSPTFFGDRSRGPILGVGADMAPTSRRFISGIRLWSRSGQTSAA